MKWLIQLTICVIILTELSNYCLSQDVPVEIEVTENPLDTQVRNGETANFTCKFNGLASECLWNRDGYSVSISYTATDKYHFTGDPDTGDCSIAIVGATLDHDDGIWECYLPQTGDHDNIASNTATLTVLIPPSEISLYRDDERIPNKTNVMYNFEDPSNITCQTSLSHPEAELKFILGHSKKELESNSSSWNEPLSKLMNTVITLSYPLESTYMDEVIVCVASHPYFGNGRIFTAAYIGSPPPPDHVRVLTSKGEESYHIQVDGAEPITLYCTADSYLPLTYDWLIRPNQESDWEFYQTGFQNLTFPPFSTHIICSAWSLDKNRTASSTEITIEVVKTQTGAIVAIVVVCVVVVVLMAAGVFGLYKKKMWCFKVPPHKAVKTDNRNMDPPHDVFYPPKVDMDEDKTTKALTIEQSEALINNQQPSAPHADNEGSGKHMIYADLQLPPPASAQAVQGDPGNTQYASIIRP